MNIYTFLMSFGAGIAFAVGATVGAILCRLASEAGRKECADDWREHRATVEARLAVYASNSARLATAAESIAANINKSFAEEAE